MGHGGYSTKVHRSTTMKRLADGDDFAYSKHTQQKPRSEWKVNELLDPKRKNQQGDNSGTIVRESLDFEEHPNTTPIVVSFDVTGSMGTVPGVIVKQLPKLMQALIDAGVPDPQVLIMAIGDAYSDACRFRSDSSSPTTGSTEQIEDRPGRRGAAGRWPRATSWARSSWPTTRTSTRELRGEKGFCFFIGDERLYANVQGDQVKQHIGVDLPQEREGVVDTKDVFADLQEKFQTYFLMSEHGGYSRDHAVPAHRDDENYYRRRDYGRRDYGWSEVLPEEQILVMPDATGVTEKIAQIIKVREGERLEV
jgi:hypothetical protein